MKTFRLRVWTNNGPSVTGRRPMRGVVEDPENGRQEPIANADDLRAFLDAEVGAGTAIIVADIADPA